VLAKISQDLIWTKILVALELRELREGSKIKKGSTFVLNNSCTLTLERN
jgi:hypothetical protein